jgi:chloramphenicol 3-O phosphotransferase
MTGKIILVNGASSSGKSTLCRALQAGLDEPFWHYSIDHFRDTGVLPMQRIENGEFSWSDMRDAFFEGFHRCLPALAQAGNNLIVEHIVETRAWLSRLAQLLEPIDVYFVGLYCPLPELEKREMQRGDRRTGEARHDFTLVHTFGTYDIEINSIQHLEDNLNAVLRGWQARTRPSAFDRMLTAVNSEPFDKMHSEPAFSGDPSRGACDRVNGTGQPVSPSGRLLDSRRGTRQRK